MENKINISDAELEVMKVLWKAGRPITAQEVSQELVNKEWKYSTIATLLGRMVEKGTATYEKRSRFFYYTPIVSEQDYKSAQTKRFVSSLFNGSVKNLVVSLFQNQEMSEADIAEIKKLFDLGE